MSRIGKLPIDIPNGVSVDIKGQDVIVKGPKGEEKIVVHNTIKVISKENKCFKATFWTCYQNGARDFN